MSPHHEEVVRCAQALAQIPARARTPKLLKAALLQALVKNAWYCTTRFKVASRGDDTHYRGVLDLVCWPPAVPDPARPEAKPNPHVSNRPPPILVEFDRTAVRHKTRAKLAAFDYPATARLVVLSEANDSPPLLGIDTILCLGA